MSCVDAHTDTSPLSAAPVEGCPDDGITFLTFYEDGVRTSIALTALPRAHGSCTLCSAGISPRDGAIAMGFDLLCATCAS